MKSHFLVLSASMFFVGIAIGQPAKAPAISTPFSGLSVRGDVQKPRVWTLSQLQKMAPLETISTTLKGQKYTAHGVKLWAVLDAAAPRLDPKSKHSEARFMVLARGSDGYTVSFALPELAPDTGNAAAFVVWESNDKPLPAKDGPLRLVVAGDKKPVRWVHNLSSLEIYDSARFRAAK